MIMHLSPSMLLPLPSLVLLAIIHIVLNKNDYSVDVDETKLLLLDIGTLVSAALVIFTSLFQKDAHGIGKIIHHTALLSNVALATFAFAIIGKNFCVCVP